MTTHVMALKARVDYVPKDHRPTDDEPFMCSRQRAYFRGKLLVGGTRSFARRRRRDSICMKETVRHPDLADRATSETERGVELRAGDRQRKLIAKIDAALARLDDGTYGYCEETGEPISLMRIEARPVATLSVDAQERHERRERFYSTD